MKKLFLCIARILFSSIFIVSSISKIFNWSETIEGFVITLFNWYSHFDGVLYSKVNIMQLIETASPIIISIAIALELIGGILIFFSINMKIGSILLLVFLFPVTFIYHPFWLEDKNNFHIEMIMFMKNLTIIGSLLYFSFSEPTYLPLKKPK